MYGESKGKREIRLSVLQVLPNTVLAKIFSASNRGGKAGSAESREQAVGQPQATERGFTELEFQLSSGSGPSPTASTGLEPPELTEVV